MLVAEGVCVGEPGSLDDGDDGLMVEWEVPQDLALSVRGGKSQIDIRVASSNTNLSVLWKHPSVVSVK